MSEYAYSSFILSNCQGVPVPMVGWTTCGFLLPEATRCHSEQFNTIEPPRSIILYKGNAYIGAPDNVSLEINKCHNFSPNTINEMKKATEWPGNVRSSKFSTTSRVCPTSGRFKQTKHITTRTTEVELYKDINCVNDFTIVNGSGRSLNVLQTFAAKYSEKYNTVSLFKSFKPRYNTSVYLADPYNVRVESDSCYNINLPDLSNIGIINDRKWNVSIIASLPEHSFTDNQSNGTKITSYWFILILIVNFFMNV